MLIPKRCIIEAMDLTTEGVKQALQSNGYSADDITASEFLGVNEDGNFVYQITFPDPNNGGDTTGKIVVYIHYCKRNNSFNICADY